jgi:hypothetical protein
VDPGLTVLERDLLGVVPDGGPVYRWIDVDVY